MESKPLWCDEFRKAVQQRLDGEPLAAHLARGVREHREACPPCCDFYDHLVQLSAITEDLLPPEEYEPADGNELLNKIVNGVGSGKKRS